MKHLALLLLLCCNLSTLSAQHIPDTAFADTIRVICPTCIDANNDLLPPAANITNLRLYNNYGTISDLTGIIGFTGLDSLFVANIPSASFPPLPNTLRHLYCQFMGLTAISNLPNGLRSLVLMYTQVTDIVNLPDSLESLCSNINDIHCLPLLPNNFNYLYLSNTNIVCLPNIPPNLNPFTLPPLCSPSTNENGCLMYFDYPIIEGIVFLDNNMNGFYDTGDQVIPNQVVMDLSSYNGYAYSTNTSGRYFLATDTNSSISPTAFIMNSNPSYFSINPASYTITTTTAANQTYPNNDFALTPLAAINDLAVDITSNRYRPGFSTHLTLTYRNVGTMVLDGQVNIDIDALLNVQNSSVTPTTQTGNTLSWAFTNLAPFESRSIEILVDVSQSTALGTILNNTATGTVIGTETALADNTATEASTVVGAFDPNDKTPDNELLTPDELVNGKPITYTIRFQNTGSFYAERVEVRDTLSDLLDIATLKNIAASHNFRMEVSTDIANPNHPIIVKWIFDNIYLQDSFTNEPASHGFVKFSIQAKQNLGLGTQIPNIAAICFDFNAPVMTDTALVEVNYPLGIANVQSKSAYHIYPNPSSNILNIENKNTAGYTLFLYNSNGQLIKTQTIANQLNTLDIQSLPSGLYLLQIRDALGSYATKIIKN